MRKLAVLIVFCSLLPPTGEAEATPPVEQEVEERSLNGHDFSPSETVRDPFITTHFSNNLALGLVEISGTMTTAEGQSELELDYIWFEERLDMQFGIVDLVAVRPRGTSTLSRWALSSPSLHTSRWALV